MSVEQNKRLVETLLHEVFTAGNPAVIAEACSLDVLMHTHVKREPFRGVAGFTEFTSMISGAFPDARVTVDDMVGEGDTVMVRWRLEGTHRGSLAGLPPTGRPVCIQLQETFHLRDGRVQELWLKLDPMNVMQQLGIIPAGEGVPRPLILIAQLRQLARGRARVPTRVKPAVGA